MSTWTYPTSSKELPPLPCRRKVRNHLIRSSRRAVCGGGVGSLHLILTLKLPLWGRKWRHRRFLPAVPRTFPLGTFASQTGRTPRAIVPPAHPRHYPMSMSASRGNSHYKGLWIPTPMKTPIGPLTPCETCRRAKARNKRWTRTSFQRELDPLGENFTFDRTRLLYKEFEPGVVGARPALKSWIWTRDSRMVTP